jgi:hypothetical protein
VAEHVIAAQPMRAYPPGRTGVLLPTDNRRAAALGVCMYTVSNRMPLLLQRAAFAVASIAGPRFFPGDGVVWPTPEWAEVWDGLRDQIAATIGSFTHVAVYRRKQAERGGLTMTVVDGRSAVAVVKVRDEPEALAREQAALQAISDAGPLSFLAPAPLALAAFDAGSGRHLHWSAQSAVFTRPHRPDLGPPHTLFADIGDALAPLLPGDGGTRAVHDDVTPWNLRLDHRGRRWLFDWEDFRLAPDGADRVYFTACLQALWHTPMPEGLPAPAVEYWRSRLVERRDTTVSDQDLTRRLLDAVTAYPGSG